MEKIDSLITEVRLLREQQAGLTTQIALSNQAQEYQKESIDAAHKQLREHGDKIGDLMIAEGQNKKARWAVWAGSLSLVGMFLISAYDTFTTAMIPRAEASDHGRSKEK